MINKENIDVKNKRHNAGARIFKVLGLLSLYAIRYAFRLGVIISVRMKSNHLFRASAKLMGKIDQWRLKIYRED